MRNLFNKLLSVVSAGALLVSTLVGAIVQPLSAAASSHREAPLISLDPQADATDLYAFVSPDRPDTVTFIANYIPFELTPGGPNWYKFGDDVLYEINIDNNGDAKDDLSFQFKFWSDTKNGNTFLYNTGPVTALNDPDLNVRQFYSVSTLRGGSHYNSARPSKVWPGAERLMVAPANVGPKSYPEGYAKVANQAVYHLPDGVTVFAGPRDDPFFVDLGGVFDVLSGISGKDYAAGLNVHTIAIQVPIKMLTKNGSQPSASTDPNAVIGVRTTSYRRNTAVLRHMVKGNNKMKAMQAVGTWVQVSRLDNPLINELVIAQKDKDRWNSSKPWDDGQFLNYVTKPELPGLMHALLGVDVPPQPRNDLVTIFLTGIPDLNKPDKVVASSQLRLNVAIPPSSDPKRLGVLAGDNAGFPNGRRLADDITDIALQAMAGGTPFTPDYNKAPNNAVADKVDANDAPFLDSFPYAQAPWDYTGKYGQ